MRTLLTTLHSKFVHNSLALPCLAAGCGTESGQLRILEFTVHEPRESILATLLAEAPDVIAFSVYLWNRRETLDLVDALGVARPELRIVLGGPEVSFAGPELFERHPGLTALVRGEGEGPLRELLEAWCAGDEPGPVPRTLLRRGNGITAGPDTPPPACLDHVPSPFAAGLADLNRGIVYYETSRGCPFRCSFCLSALDSRVRAYPMARIEDDLRLLMEREVPQVKLVDRTFNYDAERAREIFAFILAHNKVTRFHFEIAAHLLDEATLALLESVPAGVFQFEIGVQSTLESTLAAVDRRVSLARLEENVRRLRLAGRIHLHLDLVAGLPGERFDDFLASIERVHALDPHHLQIEPVKLLPGSPLREQAQELGIRFDPNPPYTILGSPDLTFAELQRLQEIGRLIDLLRNSDCYGTFLAELQTATGSFSGGMAWLAGEWRRLGLFRFPLGRQAIFANLHDIVSTEGPPAARARLAESLARDYALCERVAAGKAPAFFDTQLGGAELTWVREKVGARTEGVRGTGVKLQYFAAAFAALDGRRCVRLFIYMTRSGEGMRTEEYLYPGA